MSLVLNNSIGWACLQISGGWKRISWICAIIAVCVPLLIFGSLQLDDGTRTASTLQGWYWMLGIVQGGLLGIGVPSRVHAAIKRDRVGKLIESHRLMPTPAGHAIIGYIVGSNLLLLSCVATLFLVGLVIAVPANQDWRGWIALHAAGGGISATICCLVAFSTQWLPKFNPALFAVIFGPAMGAISATFLPPLRVLLGPYVGSGFYDLQRGEVNGGHVVSVAAQVLLSAIFFVGACRRYRRDDVPALGFGWGFALLSLWIALTLIGVLAVDRQRTVIFRGDDPEGVAYVVAVALSMLLAIGPIASSAGATLYWNERRVNDPHFIEPRPTPLPIAAVLVALAVLTLLLAAPRFAGSLVYNRQEHLTRPIHLVLTGGVIVLFIATIAALARAAARLRVPAAWLVVGWLVLMWIVPPVLDGAFTLVKGDYDSYPHAFSGVSAPFCLGLIWAHRIEAAEIGLTVQACALVGVVILWTILKRSNARRAERALTA
jgi:hypothetical protein